MQNKDDKTEQIQRKKQDERENLKLVIALLGLGLLMWVVFVGQAVASQPNKLDQCIQRAVDTIEEESGGVGMDEWFYVVSIKDGKCVFMVGKNEDYTRELLENKRRQDYQQRNQRTF